MYFIFVCVVLCVVLLVILLLVLVQFFILLQQCDVVGNVMELLGQVLIVNEIGFLGFYDCMWDGIWCVCVQLVVEEGDWLSVLEVFEKVQGQGKLYIYYVSIDVLQEVDLLLWLWIVWLVLGVGSDEVVIDLQQCVYQNVLVGGIVKFSIMYFGGGVDVFMLQLVCVCYLQDDIQVDDDVLIVLWLGNVMI